MTNNQLIALLCQKIIELNDDLEVIKGTNDSLTSQLSQANTQLDRLNTEADEIHKKFKQYVQSVYIETGLERCEFCNSAIKNTKDDITGLYTCPKCLAS